mmetsp:Transcript_22177/g.24182  ORF Transcript_22177/g.24182 Transcript_22177/m.24182 type:complete len:276 (+) Transcript_22177:43-870(+)
MLRSNRSDVNQQPSLSFTNSVVSSSYDRMWSGSSSSYSLSGVNLPDDEHDLFLRLCEFDDLPLRPLTTEEKKKIAEIKRQERFNVHDSCRMAYNNGDFQTLLDVLKNYCDENIHFISPSLFLEAYGVLPLFAFFMLIHQIFPDSMTKNLDKRIASFKHPKPPATAVSSVSQDVPAVTRETVEIIDKFTGTKAFQSPFSPIFAELLKSELFVDPPADLTAPMVEQMLNNILYTTESNYGTDNGKIHILITETKLEFDLITNKIISWTHTLLAVSTS